MEQFLTDYIWWILLAILWSMFWTGLALWKAARLNKKWWFIVLLIINSMGFLEILYIFVFSKESENFRNKKDNEEEPKILEHKDN